MQRNECKPGTEVIIRGTIRKDDGGDFFPIKVTIHHDDGRKEDVCFEPSALEAAQPKYDPARKYRKGDLVRITGFTRGFSGEEVACIELVKPIEEIEAEQPYEVKEAYYSFRVTRDDSYIHTIWWKSDACRTSPYNKKEARQKAQELCDELNRKHRESLNA